MTEQANTPALMASKDVTALVHASDMSVLRWVRAGEFPAPMKIGRRNFWFVHEINAWLANRSAARAA